MDEEIKDPNADLEDLEKEIASEISKQTKDRVIGHMSGEFSLILNKIKEDHKIELEDEEIEEDDHNNTKMMTSQILIEEQWKKYLEEPIEEDKNDNIEDSTVDLDSDNPFNRKQIRSTIIKKPNLMIPRSSYNSSIKIIKAPIYDLLVKKINFHTYLIQEYECRKLLKECREQLNDK